MSRYGPTDHAVSGVECPSCFSIRTISVSAGRSDEGIRLRRRKCQDCDAPSFVTAEVAVPATWTELDTEYRLKQRDYFRRKQGYQGRTNLARYGQTARLDIRVKVYRRPTQADTVAS